MKLVYVAGPYSARKPSDRVSNIMAAERHSIKLIRQGYAVITPHKNTAYYEYYEDGVELTRDTWIRMDLELLERCDVIYMIPGWENSRGAKDELIFARLLGLETMWGGKC